MKTHKTNATVVSGMVTILYADGTASLVAVPINANIKGGK